MSSEIISLLMEKVAYAPKRNMVALLDNAIHMRPVQI